MRTFEALKGLRIGCVQYLNSRPLICGLDGVQLAHPRVLAQALQAGELDAALVPVFELLRAPEQYVAVNGVAIASDGPVYSVYVSHEQPLAQLRGVVGDPASLSSIHLFQVLSKGALGLDLPLVVAQPGIEPGPELGRLLIGNQAIAYRLQHSGEMSFWDLGEAWRAWTGLPFVYAVWVLRRGLSDVPGVADAFRELARAGVARIPEIAAAETEFGSELALEYLSQHIRFNLGANELAGLTRFRLELVQHGFLPDSQTRLEFV